MVLGKPAEDMPRIRKTDEVPPRIALYDVISAITGLDGNHAGKAYRDIVKQQPEVHSNGVDFQFPGRGQRRTPVADAIAEILRKGPSRACPAILIPMCEGTKQM